MKQFHVSFNMVYIYITLNERSFIFGIDPNQKSDINKLVLIEIKYYIHYARCNKSNMNLTVLQHRLELLYQTYKYNIFQQGNTKIFKQTGKITITY